MLLAEVRLPADCDRTANIFQLFSEFKWSINMAFADFVNLANFSYVIDTNSIFAVNVMPGPGGQHTTFVWKIWNGEQAVAGTPAELLDRYGLRVHFAKFTSLLGELWVRADAVSALHTPFPGDNAPANVQCILSVGGSTFNVLDSLQTVRDRIETALAHG
jgi:hypothetical protein